MIFTVPPSPISGRAADCFDPVRNRIHHQRGQIPERGAGYLAYALADAVVHRYFPILEAYGERLEQLETADMAAPGICRIIRQVDRENAC